MEKVTLLAIGVERALLGGAAKGINRVLNQLLPEITVDFKYLRNYPSTFYPLVPGQNDRLIVLHGKEEGGLEDYLLIDKKILFVFLPVGVYYRKSELRKIATKIKAFIGSKDVIAKP